MDRPELLTELPRRKGERDAVQDILALPDRRIHLWANLDSLPGVLDNDLVLWHESAGVFVVEIKAVPLDAVLTFGVNHCEIVGRADKAPQVQAYAALESLLDYLGRASAPYLTATVLWPHIHRAEWQRRWDNRYIAEDMAERMLFRDDLVCGLTVLADRLAYIRRNPPVRGGTNQPFIHSPERLSLFREALRLSASQKPTQTEWERLQALEALAAQEAMDDVPPDSGVRLIYSGYPGTGKTFRLGGIGLAHAAVGNSVLYCCFNKVLSADMRRLLSHIPSDRRFEVFDAYNILRYQMLGNQSAEEIPEGEYDEWAKLALEETRKNGPALGRFQTVLVDEAQDLQNWAIEMCELLLEPGGTLCIATGRGQELYGKAPEALERLQNGAKLRFLNRNFRNSRPNFGLAFLAYETKLDRSRIVQAAKKLAGGRIDGAHPPLIFERGSGTIPELRYMPPPTTADTQAHYTALTKAAIADVLSHLEAMESPGDVLILVPNEKSFERAWVTTALVELGTHFLDYSAEANRRQIPKQDQVRVCTFHSCRGIEGTRVLVFGIERLLEVAERTNTEPEKIAYIVLSRATINQRILVRKGDSEVVHFVQAAVAELVGPASTQVAAMDTVKGTAAPLSRGTRVYGSVQRFAAGVSLVQLDGGQQATAAGEYPLGTRLSAAVDTYVQTENRYRLAKVEEVRS